LWAFENIMAKKIQEPRVDRTAFSIVSLYDEDSDLQYWLARTPDERLSAVEQIRQIVYGYNPSTVRLQRVLEIAKLKPG
jgi:hypothetical protein